MKKYFNKGNVDWYVNAFQLFENRLNGQTKTQVHQRRKKALQSFEEMGYPTTKHEEWKYTNVAPIVDHDFKISEPYSPGLLPSGDIKNYIFEGMDTSRLVFVNGHFAEEHSNIDAIKDRIKIMNLREGLEKHEDLINAHFEKNIPSEEESFVSLNTAFLEDGAFIYVPDHVIIEQPIQLLFISVPGDKPLVNFPRNLIIAGRSSQVSFVEMYASVTDNVYFTNTVGEIIAAENARIIRYKIQIESGQAYHISSLNVFLDRDSHFSDHNVTIGGSLSRNDITSVFDGEGGSCELNGLYTGNQEQHIDNHTTIDHASAHCESHELYKGILDDKAKGVFNGKIFVRPDAQKTNAIQANNCILLSDRATLDTKPQLEIFADDVKCTHGATIGQLDEDAYFYMRTRGIEKTKARKLLIYAFASEVLDKISIDAVREKISDWFSDKLHAIKPE
jgi:Fe-S cluster assembly protein SufD